MIYLVQVGPDPLEISERAERLRKELGQIPKDLLREERQQEFLVRLSYLRQIIEEQKEDEEELDEAMGILNDIEQGLSEELGEQRDELRQKLNALRLDAERVWISLRQGSDLERSIGGQVAFVMHLNELRQQLLKRRNKLSSRYEVLKNDVEKSLARHEGGPVKEALALYQVVQDGTSRWEALEAERQSFLEQESNLKQWTRLLQDTDRLFNALARTPDLQEKLTRQIVPEIQAHLTKRGAEGLPDWEVFRVKVETVEEELEKRRKHGNEQFAQVKEGYESFLRSIEVNDYRLRTRYTYGEDAGSYRDLYHEVKSKMEGRIKEIKEEIEQNQVDLLKAEYIYEISAEHRKTVERVRESIEEAQKELKALRRVLTASLIENGKEELDAYGERVRNLAQVATTCRRELGPILFAPYEISEAEQHVLDAFGQRDRVDLTDLFVSLRKGDQDLNWDEFIRLIDRLYRKNRILIWMKRRG